eukprot:45179-Prorocentrum_minimum.AAC.1
MRGIAPYMAEESTNNPRWCTPRVAMCGNYGVFPAEFRNDEDAVVRSVRELYGSLSANKALKYVKRYFPTKLRANAVGFARSLMGEESPNVLRSCAGRVVSVEFTDTSYDGIL